jgi:hypothetical protein
MTDIEAPITRAGLVSPGGLDLSVPGPNGRALLASQEADGSSARTYPRRLPVAIAEASGSYIVFWGNRTTGNTAAVPDGVNPSLQPSGTYPRAILDSHRPRRLAGWGPPATVGLTAQP